MNNKPWGPEFLTAVFVAVLTAGLAYPIGLALHNRQNRLPPCHEEWDLVKGSRNPAVLISYYTRCAKAGAFGFEAYKAISELEDAEYQAALAGGDNAVRAFVGIWKKSELYKPRHLKAARAYVLAADERDRQRMRNNPEPPGLKIGTISDSGLTSAAPEVGIWDHPPDDWPSDLKKKHYQRAYRMWLEEQKSRKKPSRSPD
jgi:hypothetical protein